MGEALSSSSRHCHRVIVIACEGRRVRSGWVRTRDGRGAVIASSLSLSSSSHVRVGEDEAWARRRRCCRMWREGGRGGYENPCRGYGYERGSARPYLYPYPRDTRHMTRAGYPYPWYTLVPALYPYPHPCGLPKPVLLPSYVHPIQALVLVPLHLAMYNQ